MPDNQLLDRIFLGLSGGSKDFPAVSKESVLDIMIDIAKYNGKDYPIAEIMGLAFIIIIMAQTTKSLIV